MKFLIITTILILISSSVYADIIDCQNLYIGRIRVEDGSGGLDRVVFLNDPSNSSGSYWVSFNPWSSDDKKSALSILMAAKLANHRVNLRTTEENGCGIQENGTTARRIELTNRP